MKRALYVCSFEAVDGLRSRMSYAEFRAAALKAGRFSVFEATWSQWRARFFTRLCRDPTVVVDQSVGFPWTKVRAKE
jgi:hypothetical protein